MIAVLHVLPHPGGGGERYVDLLASLPGYEQQRAALAPSPALARALPAIPLRLPGVARRARAADLVHVHGDVAAALSAPALARRPTIITSHGLSRLRRVHGIARLAFAAGLRAAVARARRVICTSEAERAELEDALPPALHARLVVVPNGVPAAPLRDPARRAATRAAIGVAEHEVLALFVGGLDADKDPLTAVAAATAVRARALPLVLALAGDGPLGPDVDAAARQAADSSAGERDGSAIRALGFRSDVPALFEAADAFVLSSRREGMSLALLEAMAWGLPAIVCAGSGSPEAIGADAGLVVAPGDARALAGALARLVGDPGLRTRMGGAARARAQGELSLERFLGRTRRVYEGALRGGHDAEPVTAG